VRFRASPRKKTSRRDIFWTFLDISEHEISLKILLGGPTDLGGPRDVFRRSLGLPGSRSFDSAVGRSQEAANAGSAAGLERGPVWILQRARYGSACDRVVCMRARFAVAEPTSGNSCDPARLPADVCAVSRLIGYWSLTCGRRSLQAVPLAHGPVDMTRKP
jgi:hypothetical protein